MKKTIYANYDLLADKQQPVFSVNRPVGEIYKEFTVTLPEGWKWAQNMGSAPMIEAPDGTIHLASALITNLGEDACLRWNDGTDVKRFPITLIEK